MSLPISGQIMDALAAVLKGAAATEDRSDMPGIGLLLLISEMQKKIVKI